MAGIMTGLFTLFGILAAYWVVFRLTKMSLDHSYRMMILKLNHEREMTPIRQDHERQITTLRHEHEQQVARSIAIPLGRLTVRFVKHEVER